MRAFLGAHDARMTSALLRLCLLLVLLAPAAAPAQDLSETVVLIAKRELRDRLYGHSVLVATPLGADRHVGLIINKPLKTTLGTLFPQHEPSRKVADPVFLGGPHASEVIFALVQRKESPGTRSLRIAPDLYLATDSRVVDRIIENEPSRARFFAGVVLWRAGELADEVKRGAWFVQPPRSDLVLRKPTVGLWEELVDRLEKAAKAI